MSQEFRINSSAIEDKINQLLPSQGGSGAGVDFSASTMVIPIVDLTETAEGSNVRADIQTALSFAKSTTFKVNGATSTLITTTGYWRIFGIYQALSGSPVGRIIINDGATDKNLIEYIQLGTSGIINKEFDFVVFLEAGHSLKVVVTTSDGVMNGNFRQIADVSGNLINP